MEMVFIHKDTFDMIRTDLYRIMQSNDYFAVDELIAPTIQILNRKGYITEFCCSGHAFPFVTEGYMHDDPERKIFESRSEKSYFAYIIFKEKIFLPESPALPSGFSVQEWNAKVQIEKSFFEKRVEDTEIFDFSRNILESMESLYKWALNLPDFKE